MAYLLYFILFVLFLVIMITPISLLLTFENTLKATLSLPFIDVTLSPLKKHETKKRKKLKRVDLQKITVTVKAAKTALGMLVSKARLTVYKTNNDNHLDKNISSRGKRILFSVFISYLASKSGILITNEGYHEKPVTDNDTVISALIETRVFRVLLASLSFTVIKFLPKKEYGIVR